MKQALIGSIAAAAVMATESGPYHFREEALPTYRGVAEPTRVPFAGRSSNDPRDPDIKRLDSRRADPRESGEPSPQGGNELRTGDELILKSERNKRTPDPVLALEPKMRELIPGSGIYEPVEENYEKKQAPIFLVDPKFTKEMKEEEKVLFEDNDFGGFNEPLVHSKWPLVGSEVQNFFGVDKDCKCTKQRVFITWPEFQQLNLPQGTAEVWEPQYEDHTYEVPKLNQHTMYRGDDYGGHNIPFPHPLPPKPVGSYDDAFIDLARVFGIPRIFDNPNDDVFFRFGGFGKSQADTYSNQWISSPFGHYGSDFGKDIYNGEEAYGYRGDAYHGDAYGYDDDYRGDAYRGDAYLGDDYEADYLGDDYEEDYRGESYGYDNYDVDTRYGGLRREVETKSYGGYEAEDLSYAPRDNVQQRRFHDFSFDEENNFDFDRDDDKEVVRGHGNRSYDYEGDRTYVFQNQRRYDNEPDYDIGEFVGLLNRAW